MLYATVDSFSIDRGPGALALSLAKTAGGRLTGFLANIDANVPPNPAGRSFAEMEQDFRRRADANIANGQALCDKAESLGIKVGVVNEFDHSRGMISCIADRARLHDVLVTGVDRQGLMSDRLVAENLLFSVGRPMLVTPADWTGEFTPRRVVLAWDNSRVAARALADALAVLPHAGELVLLTIGGEKAVDSSLDEQSTVATIAGNGLAVHMVNRPINGRDIGFALQEEALALGGDVLVMGGYGHSRLRDFILGGATLSVLGSPHMPVLVSH
jgi:nucleotide-binding universal stress UspA family protein